MNSENTKTCLVTGGAGFIGSHIVERLLDDGHPVVVIDNYSTGRPENLDHLRDRSGLTVHESDITDAEALKGKFDGVDWVFHMAALADIVPSMQRPMDYFNADVVGTANVLEASRAAGIKRFLYAASSSCYGIPDIQPTPETEEVKPEYPYALAKGMGEQMVMHWSQVYGLPALSLRMFNIYGPRSRTSGTYGAVFGVFLAQKLAGEPFTVVGDGEQTRDFTFVSDAVNAFVTAAHSNVSGEIMNIGSDNTYSVNRLVELLGGDVTYVPQRPGEPDCTYADTSKIKKLLGWTAKVSLEDGVKVLLENIDYWREAPVWTPDSIKDATKDWFHYLEK